MKELLLLTEKGRCYRCQRATIEQYSLRLLSKTFIRVRQENKNYKTFLSTTTENTSSCVRPVRGRPLHRFAAKNVSTVYYCTILTNCILYIYIHESYNMFVYT